MSVVLLKSAAQLVLEAEVEEASLVVAEEDAVVEDV